MQNFMPHYKKQSYAITADGLQFLKDFGKVSNYNGYIQIALKDDTKFKTICSVYLQDLADYVSKMELYPSKNYYLTATSFTKIERSYETMFSYNAIVIDIDCHVNSITMQERERLIDNFIWRFNNDCVQCKDLDSPNYVVLTGRGVQLWWFLIPVYAPQFKNCILDISAHFTGIIQNLLDEFQTELSGLEVDVAASKNPIGFFRMPGSTNPIVGKEVCVQHLSDKRLDPKSYRDEHLPFTSEAKQTVSKKKYVATAQDQSEWFEHLVEAVKKIRDLRAAPIGSEQRNNFIYLFFCLTKSIYPVDVAMSLTEEFNLGFQVPLRPQELKSTLSSAVRKHYVIGPKKIIDLLNVTDEEANLVSLMSPSTHTHISKLEETGKVNRDAKILKMYLEGAKQKDIAAAIGVTRQTVSAVLKTQNAEALLVAKTKLLSDSGVKAKEIAQKLCCSLRTVTYRLSAAKAMDECDFAKCAKMLKSCPYNGLTLSPAPRQGKTTEAAQAVVVHLERFVLKYLKRASQSEGSLCLPESVLVERVIESRKRAKPDEIVITCKSMAQKGIIKYVTDIGNTNYLYLPQNYELEANTAKGILAVIGAEKKTAISTDEIVRLLFSYESEKQIMLSIEQKSAVVTALTSPMCIITGGPGTGKTAVTDAICSLILKHNPGSKIKLCAPTGKAAVHLAESTGHPATTIHSLIPAHSIKCDYLIVDEMSMVSTELFSALIEKTASSVRIVLIGDPDQLPCIGLGNILRDLIASKCMPTVTLKTRFRQNGNSGITEFTENISGQADFRIALSTISDSLSSDISFRCAGGSVVSTVSDIVTDLITQYGISTSEIQVLTPTKKCANELNIQLRNILNHSVYGQAPADPELLMPGDRVIFCKNDYSRNLFNGTEGIVKESNPQYVTIEYANHHIVRHTIAEIQKRNLILSYALTIHKAQGSEYSTVIVPLDDSMDSILTRNLVYTAVSRAKKRCVLVSSKATWERALQRTLEGTHRSRLSVLLKQNPN